MTTLFVLEIDGSTTNADDSDCELVVKHNQFVIDQARDSDDIKTLLIIETQGGFYRIENAFSSLVPFNSIEDIVDAMADAQGFTLNEIRAVSLPTAIETELESVSSHDKSDISRTERISLLPVHVEFIVNKVLQFGGLAQETAELHVLEKGPPTRATATSYPLQLRR